MKFFQALLLVASFTARVFTAVGFAAFASTLQSVADLILPTALMFGVALWYSSANKVGSNDIFGRATAWAVVVVLVAVMSVVEASVPLSPFAKYFILALWGWETWPLFITALGLYSLTHRPTMEARLAPPPTGKPSAAELALAEVEGNEPPPPPPPPPPPAGPPPKSHPAAAPTRPTGFNPADYPRTRETKPGRPESLRPLTTSSPVCGNPK